jgi:hypothetical protein
MWADFVAWARQYFLRPGFPLADPKDLEIPHCVGSAKEASAIIRQHYDEWLRDGRG